MEGATYLMLKDIYNLFLSFQNIKISTEGSKCVLCNVFEIKTVFYDIFGAQLVGTTFLDEGETPFSIRKIQDCLDAI